VKGEIDGLYSLTNDRADEPYIYLHLEQKIKHFTFLPHQQPVRLAYQPPASSTFLSEQTSHQQPASSAFLSE
jgi:hypothetical protein